MSQAVAETDDRLQMEWPIGSADDDGARELAAFLARSEETHSAFVQQLFHYMVKQPIRSCGPQTLPELRRFFEAHDFNIRKLITEIIATSALTPR